MDGHYFRIKPKNYMSGDPDHITKNPKVQWISGEGEDAIYYTDWSEFEILCYHESLGPSFFYIREIPNYKES